MDNNTLTMLLVLIPLILVIILFSSSRRKQEQLFLALITANIYMAAGFLLISLQPRLPYLFGIITANILILLAVESYTWGSLLIYGVKPAKKLFFIAGPIMIIGISIFTYINFNTLIRISIVSTVNMIFLFYGGISILRKTPKIKWQQNLIALSLLSFGLLFFIRLISTIIINPGVDSIFEKDLPTTINLWGILLFILSWNWAIQLRRSSLYHEDLQENISLLQKSQTDLSLLNSLYHYEETEKSMAHLLNEIFQILDRRFPVDRMLVYLEKEKGQPWPLAGAYKVEQEILDIKKSIDISQIADALDGSGNELRSIDLTKFIKEPLKILLEKYGYISFKSYPLSNGYENIGMIFLAFKHGKAPDLENEGIFQTILNQCSTLIFSYKLEEKQKVLENQLRLQAITDPLTKLPNRRELLRRLREEIQKAVRYNDHFLIFLFDLDDFKAINDTYGHNVGDDALVAVSETLKKELRESDFCGRFGGEEFIGVLSRTSLSEGKNSLDRLLSAIRNIKLPENPTIKIRASMGVVEFNNSLSQPRELIKIVDQTMYKAKTSGKDRWIANEPSLE